MNVRISLALLFLVFGIIGMVVGNSYVFLPQGGSFPGNPLFFGIFSVVLGVLGVVFLISWIFSELTRSPAGNMATAAAVPVEDAVRPETTE